MIESEVIRTVLDKKPFSNFAVYSQDPARMKERAGLRARYEEMQYRKLVSTWFKADYYDEKCVVHIRQMVGHPAFGFQLLHVQLFCYTMCRSRWHTWSPLVKMKISWTMRWGLTSIRCAQRFCLRGEALKQSCPISGIHGYECNCVDGDLFCSSLLPGRDCWLQCCMGKVLN